MMYNTPAIALAKLMELGLPPIFEQIWQSHGPRRFCCQWNHPRRFFDMDLQADLELFCPRISQCVPLLECDLDELVAYDSVANEYVSLVYEGATCKVIGANYQQFLSSLFVDLGYAGLQDVVEDVAPLFGYKYLVEFRRFMETDDDDELSCEEVKARFVRSIPV